MFYSIKEILRQAEAELKKAMVNEELGGGEDNVIIMVVGLNEKPKAKFPCVECGKELAHDPLVKVLCEDKRLRCEGCR
jgi:DNA-directed RNA polymerase subunit RPC12/RpoP